VKSAAEPKKELTMPTISSIAIRVANMDAMLAFYSEAFQVRFQEVDTYGIQSQFGDMDGITLKFVPIRDDADFKGYPVHQPGFVVPDVEAVVALAIKHGGRQEGQTLQADGRVQAAVRDPDGNTIELYSE
jgi:catechol 2,3-dioxygenase-like lactoylglutathione lyase family enzyme